MITHPFSTPTTFRQAFESGLSDLLTRGGLGPFILVCANATLDPRVHAATAAGLQSLFEELRDRYVADLAACRTEG
jgi:hypothetical protein